MKAILLGAGTGTRLRPLTELVPKCLVPLRGKPLLEHQLQTLSACGVDKVSLVTGYRDNALKAYGLPSYHNPKFETTNMVASLFCAKAEFDSDLLVAYTDIVYEPRVLEPLLASTAPVAVAIDEGWLDLWKLRMQNPLEDAETLRLNSQGNIVELGKKPRGYDEIQGQYIGLVKFGRSFLPHLLRFYESLSPWATYDGKSKDQMFMTTLLQLIIDKLSPVHAVKVNHGWLEVDTLEDLRKYEALPHESALFSFTSPDVGGKRPQTG
jgi:L-glutamine-phosphate cytidylyltransferase